MASAATAALVRNVAQTPPTAVLELVLVTDDTVPGEISAEALALSTPCASRESLSTPRPRDSVSADSAEDDTTTEATRTP